MEVKPVLSVLIATMPKRSWDLNMLLVSLTSQLKDVQRPNPLPEPEPSIFSPGNVYNPPVEILIDSSMEYNIGKKRNELLKRATGDWIVFCDDDDKVAPDYLKSIVDATASNPDCIGINGTITTNGRDERKWFISKEYGRWFTGTDGTYYRTPNHISPVKRELALKAGFPEISFGEDAEYSRRLLQFLRTETKIIQPIYHYDYWQK